MTNLNQTDATRLMRLLIRTINLTGCKCMVLKYHDNKDIVNKLTADLNIQHLLKTEGFAFQIQSDKFIFYDDSLPLNQRIEVFAHEAGHCLLGHLQPSQGIKLNCEDKFQKEWEADFFSAMVMFISSGATQILRSWNREYL